MLQRWVLETIPRLIAIILVFKLVPLAAAPAEPQRRVALIIGNSNYQWVDALTNPRNDAEAFAEALKKISPKFEITKVIDMKVEDRESILSKFEKDAANAGIALFYYAGHAVQNDDDNYLLPVDMPEHPKDLNELRALRLNDVLGRMKAVTQAKLVFLDACRNNPFKKQEEASAPSENKARGAAALIRSLRGGLANPDASNFGTGDILIAYATAPGSVAQDGEGKNSPFTTALARYVAQRGVEIRKMQTLVTKDVKQATRDTQIPWFSVSLTADLYLWPPAPSPAVTTSGDKKPQRYVPNSSSSRSPPPGLGGGIGAGGQ
jgi:uncharacterized caspase-like protein